ncbi:MAG TPA: MOSC and FAD-binding oxidoreductase domain-containing protein [Mycobacterium sp.]|nr:MOSC and FAD-binding oxidoreductase domain-containing protein [Mycobacterium sp.]
MARLLSVNVGLPQNIRWKGRTVHTGVWKAPVTDNRMVRRLNIDGDGQGDLVGHGGEQRAVLVYQIGSYRYWEQELGRSDFSYGQFGDNFTVDGLADDEVCIGDRYRIGSAVFEVTQPRVTCYRVGIRMNEPQMAALLVAHHRPGFYFRVLQEGQIKAGDEILKVADGPERLTVTDADALLYLPGHDPSQLERALRIPALSKGWKTSFQALVGQRHRGGWTGNAGLALDTGPSPAWSGFRDMRVTAVRPESRAVFSVELEPVDDSRPPPAVPGQFLTLRLPTAGDGPLLRSYSLSGPPGGSRYRISIKQEPHGVAGRYLREHVQVGDTLEVAAPRGAFILCPGPGPVVLLSAGIGATPVLAMLHALAAGGATRPVWWIYGAQNGEEHPFARESAGLVQALSAARRYIAYSRPLPTDCPGGDFDMQGHLDIDVLDRIGVPRDADFYLCGPDAFMQGLTAGLAARGVSTAQIHTEVFGPGQAITPGVIGQADRQARAPHSPPGPAGSGARVSFARSGLTVAWNQQYASLLELAEACDVTVRWACRTGVCHTCVTGLLTGAVAYRPQPLEYPAEDTVLICCSRPKTDVGLDL